MYEENVQKYIHTLHNIPFHFYAHAIEVPKKTRSEAEETLEKSLNKKKQEPN